MAAALDSAAKREVRNNSSRLGLRGAKPLADGIEAFCRVELGVNLGASSNSDGSTRAYSAFATGLNYRFRPRPVPPGDAGGTDHA